MALKPKDIAIRGASALILAPAAVLAMWAGGAWYTALILAGGIMLAFEWARMSEPRDWKAVGLAVALGVTLPSVAAHLGEMSVAFVLLVVGATVAGLWAYRRGGEGLDGAYGVLYLGWPCVLLVWMRSDLASAPGLYWTVLVFAVAWAADILAYLVGSAVGGPKLWPRFSPNKTWSGFIGGLLAGSAAGAAMAAGFDMGALSPVWGGVLGLMAALATMGGDLWESALKRRFGVKDAGNLIPGHGGLLDRVDGLMFAVVVVAVGRLIVVMFGADA